MCRELSHSQANQDNWSLESWMPAGLRSPWGQGPGSFSHHTDIQRFAATLPRVVTYHCHTAGNQARLGRAGWDRPLQSVCCSYSLKAVFFPSDLDKRLCIEQECPGREWFQTNLRWGMWQPQLRRWDRAGASAMVGFTMSLSSSVQECGPSPASARPGFSREPPSCPSSFSPLWVARLPPARDVILGSHLTRQRAPLRR